LTPPAPDFPKARWRGCAWALSSAHGDRFHWIRVPRRPRRARAL
jgi:hypothetical protein